MSVVVPHYNDLEGLRLCLEALGRQTVPIHEIVVADNDSPVGPAAVAAVIGGRARLVVVTDRGAGPARNGGASAASGEVLAFTDSDCVPEPQWLERALAALEGWDLVGGRMTVLVGDPAAMTPVEAFEAVFAFNNERYVRRKGFSVTANLVCRADTFAAVGGFGVGLSEDVEWCRRATARGLRLGYAPEAVVGHPARRTWDELIRKWRRINREGYLLAREEGGAARFLLRALALPASILLHAPVVFASRALTRPRDRIAAVAVLARLRLWRLFDSLKLSLTPGQG